MSLISITAFSQQRNNINLELGTVLADGYSQYDFSAAYLINPNINNVVTLQYGGGLGLTYQNASNADYSDFILPIFINGRIIYPISQKLSLFFDFRLGYSFSTCGIDDKFTRAGVYLLPQVGISISRFTFGIGYSYQKFDTYEYQTNNSYVSIKDSHIDGFSIRIGMNF